MKFVFLGYDFMLPVATRLIEDGHELIGVMSFECDNIFNFNQHCQALTNAHGVPFITSPVSDIHTDSFIGKGTELFISAGYPFKIPPIDETKAKGINLHPTFLPHARGLMPIPHIIMNDETDAAGITLHKLTQNFDEGDILAQEKIDLTPKDTVETYCAKTLLIAPDIVSNTLQNFEEHWQNAKPQDNENAWAAPTPSDETRTLNWNSSTEDLIKCHRAFGRFGCIAHFKNKTWSVFDFEAWIDTHNHEPGTIQNQQQRMVTIATKDGFICLTDFQEMV